MGNAEVDLLVEVLRRYETALGALRDTMQRREYAKGMARPSFADAWAEGAKGFNELGNWLDAEIDRRTPIGGQ